MEVGNDLASPGRARARLRERLTELRWEPTRIDEACLVLTELVTNAIIHGGGLTSLHVASDASMLRIEVGDASSTHPVQRHASSIGPGGRGLLITQHLTERWGTTRRADHQVERKRVWCTMRGQEAPIVDGEP